MNTFFKFIKVIFNHGWKGTKSFSKDSNPVIIETSLDEIIFTHREKEYGAFALRKNYPWHLATAVGLVGSAFLYICFLPVILGWLNRENNIKDNPISICCCIVPGEISPPPPPGYRTPSLGKMLSAKELEEIRKQITFKIPKPTPPKDLYYGNGSEEISTTPKPSELFDYTFVPDITLPLGTWEYEGPLEWEVDSGDHYVCVFGIEEEEKERVVQEIEPDFTICTFADEFPSLINAEEIKSCINLPAGEIASSYEFVFQVLVNKKGQYQDHKLVRGKNHRFARSVEKCIDQMKFTPAIQGNKPVEMWVNVPFRVEFGPIP